MIKWEKHYTWIENVLVYVRYKCMIPECKLYKMVGQLIV